MTTEIIFYGIGGQGAVVAAKLLADAAAKSGYQVQSFAAYGAERRGGKVESYVRLSKGKLLVHSKVYEKDFIVAMDDSFAKTPQLISGMKERGGVLINSPDPPEAFSLPGDFRIVTVDAGRIAVKHGLVLPSGTPVINTTMLGAFVGMNPSVSIDQLAEAIREGKIPLTEKNVNAAREAYLAVKSQLQKALGTVAETAALKISVEQRPIYRTGIPQCEAHCPAGHAIRRTISLVQDDRFEEALENIKLENPFPGICGRVCFRPCEAYCNRNEYDEGLAINALERAVFDYANMERVKRPIKKERTGRKVAIIGSGPAGMTCAYFLAILGHNVTVFEALPVLGGIPRVGIPDYRLPKNVVDREMEQVIELGIDVRTNTEVGKDVSFEYITKEYDACFIGTGAHKSMRLGIPGEDREGVLSGLEFVKGIALDGEPSLGARVVVVGGGNVAIDVARTAKRLGAPEVQIVCLESREIMPAYWAEVEEAMNEGIGILYQTMPVQIHRTGKRVDRLECMKVTGGRRDKQGWLQFPEKTENTNFMISADTIMIAIGEAVEAPFLPNVIEMHGRLIKVDCLGRTSVKGVYAGGDATSFSRSVVEAIGSGKRAAVGIDIFLKGGNDKQIAGAVEKGENGAIVMERYLTGDYSGKTSSVVSFKDLNAEYFSPSPRAHISEIPVSARLSNFNEVSLGLSRTEAIEEARRCFHCGGCNLCENCYIFCPDIAITFDEKMFAFTIDYDLCKSCGICIEECPHHAIIWEGEAE